VEACDALLTAWHGQGPIHVPGDLRVRRTPLRVTIDPPPLVE
jgi:tRNA(Ile)-lysidine synthase